MSTTTVERRQSLVSNTVETAKTYFPHNPYLRVVHYCRTATMERRCVPGLSPTMITPFIVGLGGYGKTSIMREYARTLGIGYRERKLAGIVDIAEVLGMVMTLPHPSNPRKGLTVYAQPEWWPDPEDNPNDAEGIVVWDDWTRAHPSVINAIMQLLIDGRYNDLVLPDGWSFACTGNPEEGHNVTSLDAAQNSRLLLMAYNRPVEQFWDQLEKQGVHPNLKNYWIKNKETTDAAPCILDQPENNDRLKMVFAAIYEYLLLDSEVLNLVGNTMFGPGFVTALKQLQDDDQPLEPTDILDNWNQVSDKFEQLLKKNRTDITGLTVVRLVTHMNAQGPDAFNDQQFKNMAAWGMTLPKSETTLVVQKLCSKQNPKGTDFSRRITSATMENGKNGEFVKKMSGIMQEMTEQLKALA